MIIINQVENILDKGLDTERVVKFKERQLTPDEKKTVTSEFFDGRKYIHYQGDEPPKPSVTIEQLKYRRIIDIDNKTSEIISRGFTFDGNKFSLSDKAQNNWNKIILSKLSNPLNEMKYPISISTLDEKEYLLTWDNIEGIYDSHLIAISSAKVIGTKIKQKILDAVTQKDLDEIKDDRE